ncbi:MAG TPA: hypothetical protein VG871_03565 [Vicinamibacterales bacterium]|nr:hypothetical protein [Vicinamibacterales bacterium]
MVRRACSLTLGVMLLVTAAPAGAADTAGYRQFTLGASTADVVARAGATARDVKTLHQRPALLEELAWRPPYKVGVERDPVEGIVFGFIDHQLFQIVVQYERSRTEGLTKADLIASLSGSYGPPSTAPVAPRRRSELDSLDTPTVLATWRQGDTSIVLQQSAYSGTFGLVIVSVPLQALARKAEATAVTMDAREAPQREAARAKAEADAAKASAEKTRTTNKAAFTP